MDVVTGAFSFSGRYVAAHLLDLGREVRTLTRRTASENPFQGKVDVRRLDFGDSAALADALDGADTLYNTYWIRFPHEGLGWENWDPREFLEGMARGTGQRMGTAFAAPFEVFPMGWGE